MKIKNKELIQSYVLTTAKYNFTVDEKRILYRVVERLQDLISGRKLNEKYSIQDELYGDKILTFDIVDFLLENSKNNSRVIKALTDINNKSFEYVADGGWELIRLIESPKLLAENGKIYAVRFRLDMRMYDAFLDFSKGFKKFELELSMKFKTTSAMRFYELFSNQKTPLTYSIEELKAMFGLKDKYNDKNGISNFINKVVKPAKVELDKHSPWSFNIKYKDREFKKAGKIHNILFIPYEIPKNRSVELEQKNLQKQVSIRYDLPKVLIDMLKMDYGFESHEISRNLEVFTKALKLPDFRDIYSRIKPFALDRDSPKGYLITSLRKEIEKQKKD